MASSRWIQGRELSREAFDVVKANRHLYGFAVRSAAFSVATLLVLGVLAVGAALALNDDLGGGIAFVLLIVAALVSACIVARFQGGMVAAADTALRGEPSSYEQGMRDSSGHVGTLTAWGLINGTVGVVLGTLQGGGGQSGGIGLALRVLGSLISLAWAAITFFVVPVILFEGLGAVPSIKRSASILKAKWGPAVSGVVHVGVRFAILFFIPGLLLIFGGGWLAVSGEDSATITLGALLAAIGLALCIVGGIMNSTVRSVFGVALYRYATTGEALGPFTEAQLVSSMKMKGEK
jgi:hypothetical protein